MPVINNRSFGLFWQVSWTITQFLGPEAISKVVEPQGARMCRSSTLAVFIDFDPFRGLLLTILGVLKRCPWLSNPKVCIRVDRKESQLEPFVGLLLSFVVPK